MLVDDTLTMDETRMSSVLVDDLGKVATSGMLSTNEREHKLKNRLQLEEGPMNEEKAREKSLDQNLG